VGRKTCPQKKGRSKSVRAGHKLIVTRGQLLDWSGERIGAYLSEERYSWEEQKGGRESKSSWSRKEMPPCIKVVITDPPLAAEQKTELGKEKAHSKSIQRRK